ncbi:MAG TPA: hypothetical protein VEW72_11235 [Burkholderiales bacterium]|nr:hypothetical protein [Burkholderiales bacterium]
MSSAIGPSDTRRPARRRLAVLGWILGLAGLVGYQLLLHRIVSADPRGIVAELLIVMPLLLIAAWLAGRSRFGPLAGIIVALLGIAGCLAWNRAGTDGMLPLLPHLAVYFLLLGWFGGTLRPGREPLVTFMARHAHESMSPELLVYTRHLTIAWCVFFLVMALTSTALFAWASAETWSLFANLLNMPLVIAMFVAEYLWRRLRHPELSRTTIPVMIQAFMKLGSSDSRPPGSA